MARVILILLISFLFLRGSSIFGVTIPFSMEEYLDKAHVQKAEIESPKTVFEAPPTEEPAPQWQRGRIMMVERMGMPAEEMMERMKGVIAREEVPFYREKTFLVMVTVGSFFIIAWMIKRWGIFSRGVVKNQGSFVNEAILVVDLCESTKLAVTQGDAFAMRIKNKMKQCVREVCESFGAKFFENIGDGYLITFPTGTDAIRAAIKILQNANDYNKGVHDREKIELRVGVNYGELIMDEQGARHGAAINKAFRIEGLKKEQQESLGGGLKPEDFPDKNRIIVSEELKEQIKGIKGIEPQLVGVFNLKGFTGLHRIYYIPWKDIALG